MKHKVLTLLVLAVLLGVSFDAAAWRGHRHRSSIHFNLGYGPGYWGPSYYRPWGGFYDPWPGYYYQPRTVIIERDPPVYIEKPQASVAPRQPAQQAQAAAPRVWYYCTDPAGYYPYVQNCTQPWVHVDPTTVAPPPARPANP